LLKKKVIILSIKEYLLIFFSDKLTLLYILNSTKKAADFLKTNYRTIIRYLRSGEGIF